MCERGAIAEMWSVDSAMMKHSFMQPRVDVCLFDYCAG